MVLRQPMHITESVGALAVGAQQPDFLIAFVAPVGGCWRWGGSGAGLRARGRGRGACDGVGGSELE